jgi:predicted permease
MIMSGFIQDVRFGLRLIRSHLPLAVTAMLTLGLGIAVVTTVFGWIDSLFLRPIPGAAAPHELVSLEEVSTAGQYTSCPHPDYRDYQKGVNLLSGLAAWHLLPFTIGKDQDAQRIYGQVVSSNFFSVLGVNTVMGRTFTADEDRDIPAAFPYAVISERLWRSRFHSDPAVLGQPVPVNGRQITIVGIAPADFYGTVTGLSLDIWVHFSMIHEVGGAGSWQGNDRNAKPFVLIGRLRTGATTDQARAQVESVARRLAVEYPETHSGVSATLLPLWKSHSGAQAILLSPVRILVAVVVLVLLIACSNVANLLLAQTVSRQREFAIRLSLGVGRARLLRQVLIESLLLALGGTVTGLVLMNWMGKGLGFLLPETGLPLRGFIQAEFSARVVLFAVATCVVSASLTGIVPALHSARTDVIGVLKDGGRSATGGPGARRARSLLVIAEVALASLALSVAAIFTRSFHNVSNVKPGFDPDGVYVAALYLSSAGYNAEQEKRFCRTLRQRLEGAGGIEAASYAIHVPMMGSGDESVRIEGYIPNPGESMLINRYNVGPGFFRLLHIPLISGREFTERDDADALPVLVVNESFARRFFGRSNPIGRKARVALGEELFTIVGVVKDCRLDGPVENPRPYFFAPFQQMFASGHEIYFYFRTSGKPADALGVFRREVAALDSTGSLYRLHSLAGYLSRALYAHFVAAGLVGVLGALSLILSAVGLYSVMSYAVAERTHEIGIRMALGAGRANVLGMVLGDGMVLAFAGILLGAMGAAAATRVVASMLVGVSSADPISFAAAALFLSLVALMASYFPARRAASVSPMVAISER